MSLAGFTALVDGYGPASVGGGNGLAPGRVGYFRDSFLENNLRR
jgi:hypothetical protein